MQPGQTSNNSKPLHHVSVIAPRSLPPAAPVDPAVLKRLRDCYVDDVADVVGPLYTMDSGIRPMHMAKTEFVGQAVTVKAVPGDNLALFGALADIRPGDVLVVDWRGTMSTSVQGASMLIAAIANGLEALVVDGAVRDVAEIAALKLPLFARGICASPAVKREVGEVNVTVSCGGVVVEPGDIVMGGEEGLVVIPRADLDRVLDAVPPYTVYSSLDDWPIEKCRARSLERAEQYRSALADVRARIGVSDD